MGHAYEDFLIEVGLYGNIFTMDFSQLGLLATDGMWFKNFWEFASHHGVQVKLSEEYHSKPVREGDCSIMGLLILGGFKDKKTVERLNRVRKHKGMVNLSDGVSCYGRCIESWVTDNTGKEEST